MAPSQKSLLLTGARSPPREAHASPRVTEGSQLSACLQTLPQAPREPPLLARWRGRSRSSCRWRRGKGGRISHLSPRALFAITGRGGGPLPTQAHPEDGRQLRRSRRRGWVRSPPVAPLISGALEHLCFPRHGRGGGVRGGGAHPASSEPLSGAASSVPAVWQLRRQCYPSPPQRSGVLGKQLGRAMGAGEPLKHEEPVAGVRRGQLLFRCRSPGSLGEWTRKTSCFPSQRAERGPEFPGRGQLAPASLSKSIFLTTSMDGPKPLRMEKCSLSSWAACMARLCNPHSL